MRPINIGYLHDPHFFKVLYKLPFGSMIFNTGKSNSANDSDYIYLVKEDTGDFVLRAEDRCYNENCDVTIVNIDKFINGLKNCSNVEFFEALHTYQGTEFLKECDLELEDFYTPRMAKAYLGYAKRDSYFLNDRIFYIAKCLWLSRMVREKNLINPLDTKESVYHTLNYQLSGLSDVEVRQLIDKERKSLKYED